jgi:hypothetical protein
MKIILLPLFYFGLLFGQDSLKVEIDPCSDPLLILARKNGIKAVGVINIFKYRKLVKACEKQGGELVVQQIELQDFERDYRKSKTMASWTSTYSVCVFIIMTYYFIGLGTATE